MIRMPLQIQRLTFWKRKKYKLMKRLNGLVIELTQQVTESHFKTDPSISSVKLDLYVQLSFGILLFIKLLQHRLSRVDLGRKFMSFLNDLKLIISSRHLGRFKDFTFQKINNKRLHGQVIELAPQELRSHFKTDPCISSLKLDHYVQLSFVYCHLSN